MKGKKKFNKSSKKPAKKSKEFSTREAYVEEVNFEVEGKVLVLQGRVETIAQTGGPTLFSVYDGTGVLALKGFVGPGERAYPEIEEGDYVRATVKINEYNGSFEGEIMKIFKLKDEEAKRLEKSIEEIQRKGAEPMKVDFLVKSPILDKLRDEMFKAATEIRLAVMQSRPIIVRHHNDVDGYSSGFVLERAILPLIEKQHGGGKSAWEFFARAPCQAPFYEIDDSIRDTSNSLRNVAKFSNKMPLVIIADNGSTEQDLIGIQQGKVHGADFIVIDHHPFEKDVISKEVLAHINPFLVGESGGAMSAGMLCAELARFISEVDNITQVPAMAGMADRIDLENPKIVEDYMKIAEKEGYTKELLRDIGTVIDFVSAKLRFMEAREYIEVVFGEPREQQKTLVSLMAPYIKNLEAKGLEMAKTAATKEKIGSVTLQSLPITEAFPGFGFYPKPGMCVSMVHDYANTKEKVESLVTAGLMPTAITFRATDEANFSVGDLIAYLNKELPQSFTNGGGHKNAGSINFVPGQQEKVLELVKKFIKARA